MSGRTETGTGITIRLADATDAAAIAVLIARSIDRLQQGFLDPAQIAASPAVMGLDTQLIADGTYFVAERDGRLAGAGGWSLRATLYGGDTGIVSRDPKRLDPARDPARIRAMYTDPDFARQGIGRLILSTCEQAAARAGFGEAELMATLSGQPLYAASGYTPTGTVTADAGGIPIPLVRMRKRLSP